jgi:predicted ATPase
MLGHIGIENFKSFKGRHIIELKPITLLFGKNSTGKSAIIQCLDLIKQTLISSNKEGSTTLVADDELGLFQDFISDHDKNNVLKIKLVELFKPKDKKLHGIEYCFSAKKSNQAELSSISITSKYFPTQEVLADFERVDMTDKLVKALKNDYKKHRYSSARPTKIPKDERLKTLTPFKFKAINKDEKIWEKAYVKTNKNKHKILRVFNDIKKATLKEPSGLPIKLAKVNSTIKFYKREFSLREFINRVQYVHKSFHLFYKGNVLGDFLLSTTDNNPIELFLDDNIQPFPLFAELFPSVNTHYIEMLNRVKMLGAFRIPPKRYYSEIGSTASLVGYSAEKLPNVLIHTKNIKTEINRWLKKLEVPYNIDIKNLGVSNDLVQISFVDKRKKSLSKKAKTYNMADVGFGVSQLVPIIVQCIQGNNNILTIMEPEAHLQPGLQANLGELFVNSFTENNNQLIIETHSEHIILRIQKLVRNGKISNEDVSINYISSDDDGYSHIHNLRMDKRAKMVDYWPGGFFTERLKEFYD